MNTAGFFQGKIFGFGWPSLLQNSPLRSNRTSIILLFVVVSQTRSAEHQMTPKLGKQFLIVLSVSPCIPDRLRMFVPAIKSLLERLSTGAIEQLFRSMSADHFGYLIRSKFVANRLHTSAANGENGWFCVFDRSKRDEKWYAGTHQWLVMKMPNGPEKTTEPERKP